MVSLATAVPWDPAAGKGAESGALPTGATTAWAIDGSKSRSGAAADPSSAAACPRASVLRGAMVPRGGWAGRTPSGRGIAVPIPGAAVLCAVGSPGGSRGKAPRDAAMR
jgi:hypothetical protein